MAHKRVKLKRTGSLPTVRLRFGQQLFGKYSIYLYDRDGANHVPIAVDQTGSDTFTVGTNLVDLHQRILYWQAAISIVVDRPDQIYVMTTIIGQDGQVMGEFEKRGPITNTVIDEDTVRFILE